LRDTPARLPFTLHATRHVDAPSPPARAYLHQSDAAPRARPRSSWHAVGLAPPPAQPAPGPCGQDDIGT